MMESGAGHKMTNGLLINPFAIGAGKTGNSVSMDQLVQELEPLGIRLHVLAVHSRRTFVLAALRHLKNGRFRLIKFIIFNSSAVLRKKEARFLYRLAKLVKLPVVVYYRESKYQLDTLSKVRPIEAARVRAFISDPYIQIWANSEFTALDNKGLFAADALVVHNGVAVNSDLIPVNADHLKLFPPTVLQIGTVQNLKGWEIFLETAERVVKEVPEVQFVWLGEGEERQAALDRVKALGLSEQVFFPGYVSNPDLLIRNAHVFFQTSLRESFSLTTAQAMAYGKEIVMFKGVGGAEEVVGAMGTVLDERSAEVAATTIVELLSCEPVLRQDLMKRYQELYALEAHGKRIAEAICQLLNVH